MPYCSRCGVEVDPHIQNCPLCQTPIMKFPDQPQTAGRYPPPHSGDPSLVFATREQRKTRIFLFLTTLLVIPGLVLMALDYFVTQTNLSWSLVPVFSLAATFFYLFITFYFYKSFLKVTIGIVLTTAVFLLSIDSADGLPAWFFALGLPILVLLAGMLIATYYIIKHVKNKGYNVFAIALTAISLFCLALDALIRLHTVNIFGISWSIVVALTLLPLAGYLFLLHYSLKRRLDFKRTFHV